MLNDVYLKGTCLKILKAFMFHINIKMSLGSVKEFQGCHTLREFRETQGIFNVEENLRETRGSFDCF